MSAVCKKAISGQIQVDPTAEKVVAACISIDPRPQHSIKHPALSIHHRRRRRT